MPLNQWIRESNFDAFSFLIVHHNFSQSFIMKFKWIILMSISIFGTHLFGQSMSKKYKEFTVSRELPFSAEEVWSAVAIDYGNIANSHPKIIASEYTAGSLKGGQDAQRLCYFNEKRTQSLKEQIVDWDAENMVFVNRVVEAKKFPINEDNTRAIYKVESLGPNQSRISMNMQFRTRPAFMGFMAKGQFKNLIKDYFIAIEHNLKTGEKVTASNFKQIKKDNNYSR